MKFARKGKFRYSFQHLVILVVFWEFRDDGSGIVVQNLHFTPKLEEFLHFISAKNYTFLTFWLGLNFHFILLFSNIFTYFLYIFFTKLSNFKLTLFWNSFSTRFSDFFCNFLIIIKIHFHFLWTKQKSKLFSIHHRASLLGRDFV